MLQHFQHFPEARTFDGCETGLLAIPETGRLLRCYQGKPGQDVECAGPLLFRKARQTRRRTYPHVTAKHTLGIIVDARKGRPATCQGR